MFSFISYYYTMKKLLFLGAVILVTMLPKSLFAQLNVARTNIDVFVSSFQSLVISDASLGAAGKISDSIDNSKNVQLGKTSKINVFSLGKFVLKVSARDDFHDVEGPEIPPSSVYVSSGAVPNSNYDPSDYIFERDVNLALNRPKSLIHSQTAGALNNSFEIEYYASGLGYEDVQSGNLDGTVVYTIEVE